MKDNTLKKQSVKELMIERLFDLIIQKYMYYTKPDFVKKEGVCIFETVVEPTLQKDRELVILSLLVDSDFKVRDTPCKIETSIVDNKMQITLYVFAFDIEDIRPPAIAMD